jgi:hypothetical protein
MDRQALDGAGRQYLEGRISSAEAARQHGLTVAEGEYGASSFCCGGENALRTRSKDEEALKDEQIKKMKQKIRGLGAALPFGPEDDA